ncbi:hypothetical protein Tco_0645490 [Tanacetum coccineum]
MVAYLKKTEGCEGFHQIVYFLNAGHIRYALTENPTIYVSLIKQFWEIATARTLDNGEVEVTATIDDKVASTGVDARYGGTTTTITGLKAGQGSGNIDKTPIMPHDSPLPRVNTLRSDECSIQLEELMVFYINLSKKVESLETDLKQTKQVYGATYTKLIMKERKIDEIDQDPDISLVQHDVEIWGRHRQDMEFESNFDAAKEVSTANLDVSTAEPVSTAGAVVTTASPTKVSIVEDITMAETLVYIRRSASKDNGKGKMDESEPVQTKTKLQQEQERLGYEAAVRLQAELEEEERQRIAKTEAVEKYSFDEIKTLFETTMREIKTFVPIESEVDRTVPELAVESSKRPVEEELVQESSLQTKYPIIDWEIYIEYTRKYWKIIRVGNHTEVYHFFDDILKAFDRDDLVMLWSLVKERFNSTEPTDDKEREIWVELKRLFEQDTDDELWKLQKHIHDLT